MQFSDRYHTAKWIGCLAARKIRKEANRHQIEHSSFAFRKYAKLNAVCCSFASGLRREVIELAVSSEANIPKITHHRYSLLCVPTNEFCCKYSIHSSNFPVASLWLPPILNRNIGWILLCVACMPGYDFFSASMIHVVNILMNLNMHRVSPRLYAALLLCCRCSRWLESLQQQQQKHDGKRKMNRGFQNKISLRVSGTEEKTKSNRIR